jgi:hypothetical protein
MRKRHLVVGVFLVMAGFVVYQLRQPTEASPAAVELVEVTPGIAFKAAVVPLVMTSESSDVVSVFDSISDAAVLGATGATLLVIAAGVRRRAC